MRPDPSLTRLALRGPGAWIGLGLAALGLGQAALGLMMAGTPAGWMLLGLGGALLALGGGLLGWAWRAARRLRRLALLGAPSPAIITEIRRSRVKVENRPQFQLVYAYRGADGRERQGVSRLGPEDRFAGLKPGRGATVYVDADDPSRSVWAGDLD